MFIFDEHDRRDDPEAPSTVLLAARQLRRSIHTNTEGGKGLIIHCFRVRRRESHEIKSNKKAHAHSLWCVECLVCANGKPQALDDPSSSNHALHNFERGHLRTQSHLEKGSEILAALDLVEETAMLDDSAAAAAADCRLATESQALPLSTNDSSRRRDSTAVSHMELEASPLEVLVRDCQALEWVYDGSSGSSSSSSIVRRVKCVFCNFTSAAEAGDALLLSELTGHLTSERHENLRAHRGGLLQMFRAVSGPAPAPPPPPDLTRLCWGYFGGELEVAGSVLKTNVLMNYDTSNLDWHAEPYTKASFTSTTPTGSETITINGTYRSEGCARYCTLLSGARLPNLRCHKCAMIKSKPSFRHALQRGHAVDKDTTKINFRVMRLDPSFSSPASSSNPSPVCSSNPTLPFPLLPQSKTVPSSAKARRHLA